MSSLTSADIEELSLFWGDGERENDLMCIYTFEFIKFLFDKCGCTVTVNRLVSP